jgi:hypothetical protein
VASLSSQPINKGKKVVPDQPPISFEDALGRSQEGQKAIQGLTNSSEWCILSDSRTRYEDVAPKGWYRREGKKSRYGVCTTAWQ